MSFLTNMKARAAELTQQAKKIIPHANLSNKIDIKHRIPLNKPHIE